MMKTRMHAPSPAGRATLTPEPRQTFHLDRVASPIGTLLIVHDDVGAMRALDFDDHETRMHRLLRLHYGAAGRDFILDTKPVPEAFRVALDRYFGGDLRALESIPVATAGTAFQRDVWAGLREIPAGTAISYGTLALRLGRPKAVRAVGLANGANPIGIVVPCHRVIGADTSLTGYGGGLARKTWLLEHEGIVFRSPDGAKGRKQPRLFDDGIAAASGAGRSRPPARV